MQLIDLVVDILFDRAVYDRRSYKCSVDLKKWGQQTIPAIARFAHRTCRRGGPPFQGKDAPEISARIGLECGLVVVDSTGEMIGDATNVASRVQTAAEPRSVLVTTNVLRQVPGLFSIRCNPGIFARLRSFASNILRFNGVENVCDTRYRIPLGGLDALCTLRFT